MKTLLTIRKIPKENKIAVINGILENLLQMDVPNLVQIKQLVLQGADADGKIMTKFYLSDNPQYKILLNFKIKPTPEMIAHADKNNKINDLILFQSFGVALEPDLVAKIAKYNNKIEYCTDQLSNNYWEKKLFVLENWSWSSVTQYCMYKMYQGTEKGNAIKHATNLAEAINLYSIHYLPFAQTPKQVIENKKYEELVNSGRIPHTNEQIYKLLEEAVRTKFEQNTLLKAYLQNMGTCQIQCNDYTDEFGYPNNNLGRILTQYRNLLNGIKIDNIPTNNLILYKKINGKYYMYGNPTPKLLSLLGKNVEKNFKKKNEWVLQNNCAKKIIIDNAYSDNRYISYVLQKQCKMELKKILNAMIIISKLKNNSAIDEHVIEYVVNTLFSCNINFADKDINYQDIPNSLLNVIFKICKKNDNILIGEREVTMIYYTINKILKNILNSDTLPTEKSHVDNIIQHYYNNIINTPIKRIPGLNDREALIINAFNNINDSLTLFLKNDNVEKSVINISAVKILVGEKKFAAIKQMYTNRINAAAKKSEKFTGVDLYKYRYDCNIKNINAIYDCIKTLPKKIVLLLLCTIDYLMTLKTDILETNANIIIFTKIIVPAPTPIPTPTATATASASLETDSNLDMAIELLEKVK